jgi:large subunit ribosomal protein L3
LKEFPVSAEELAELKPGDQVSITIFAVGQKVDVTGQTIGKGFSGAIKRHHFKSQNATHGNSVSHQALGSTGMAQDPGRVFPGKKMAGHLGAVKRTQQNLEVVRVDVERQLLLLKGAVPGSKGVGRDRASCSQGGGINGTQAY